VQAYYNVVLHAPPYAGQWTIDILAGKLLQAGYDSKIKAQIIT